MRPPFWLEQILRSRRRKPRSNAPVGRRKNRRRMIPSCSALSTWSLHSRFIKSGNVHPLEERIGYKFRNSLFLAEALTHPSLGHEMQQHRFDNQRLEFLGDAILQLVITEHLYGKFHAEPEGQLTKLRSRLVSRDTLKKHALALDLGHYLLMGRGEEASGGRARTSTLADAFEALIGAIYLDGDLDPARRFILTQAQENLAQITEEPVDVNPKGQLQGLLQSISPLSPVYE